MRLKNYANHVLICSLAAGTFVTSNANASTAEFMTRLYTEALGRAPDSAAWQSSSLMSNTQANCSGIDFYQVTNNFYTSAEFNNLGYTNLEKAITLYRGILNREPESLAAVDRIATGLNSNSISAYVQEFVNSTEFRNGIIPKICNFPSGSDSTYRWGTVAAVTVNQSETGMTAIYLQGLLNAAQGAADPTVRLNQHAVIFADRTITIPAGVTLTTVGSPAVNQYAKMARIVRTKSFDQPLVMINSGGSLNGIWVSGQRDHIVNGVSINYSSLAASVYLNSGTNTSLIGSRIDTVTGGTNVEVRGEEATGIPCSNINVKNNLITGYASTHYKVNNTPAWSDGITVKCGSTTVSSNTVIDPTDVGIAVFYSGGSTAVQRQQASKVTQNIVISSGVSAYGAFIFEPYYSSNAPPFHYDFTGASFNNNQFWSASNTHFDIGIAVGGKAWHANTGSTGKNATVTGNTNSGIKTTMQIGIAVDGMADTYVSGNNLNYVLQSTGNCPKQAIIADAKYESGLENGVQVSVQQANTTLIDGNSHPYYVADANNCQIGFH